MVVALLCKEIEDPLELGALAIKDPVESKFQPGFIYLFIYSLFKVGIKNGSFYN